MSGPEKIAIIGSGPAGFGALARLVALKRAGRDLEITVFASGNADQEARVQADYKERFDARDINQTLKSSKALGEGGLLPPRCFNNEPVTSHRGHDGLKTEIKISDSFGGIGNYWSSSVFPNHHLHDPVVNKLGDLKDHYDFIADLIPVAGQKDDPLSCFFDESSLNQPGLDLDPALDDLRGTAKKESFDLAIGANRFALKTEASDQNACIACGDCMYGCPRDAIFRAARPIWEMAQEGLCQIIYEEVVQFSGTDLKTVTQTQTFDKIFVCGGALGSSQLVRNSLGKPEKQIELYDTMLWYFPALSFWPKKTGRADRGIAFAELAGGLCETETKSYNHLLVSRFPNAIVDNVLGRSDFSQLMASLGGKFALIAAMYGSDQEYITYGLEERDGSLKAVSKTKSVEHMDEAKFKAFAGYLSDKGWYAHKKLVMENATSSHYAANLGFAYGIDGLPQHGQISPNIYICDSAGWDGPSMSQQHSFTIMANASRLVQQTL
ncbi:hypothetical protein RYZ26_14775 [Terasakiella sp. A23]|uniref:hypothetical protein n=1 Tax=Terasakiella sp. FCG-A23 TaxID=3080561 RepID=UPI002954C695|nr:hypothetical protein [Terasakiella sp. A23]MDV7340868.1 hypothetical protein [Terasakiella sp. A23]